MTAKEKKFFESVKEDFEEYEKSREDIIKKSRDILKDAKLAISLLHQDKLAEAKKLLDNTEKEIKVQYTAKNDLLSSKMIGALDASIEEFLEAKAYYNFVKNKEIIIEKEEYYDSHIYLKALSDLSGELERRAVLLAIKNKYDEVKEIYDAVVFLNDFFLSLSMSNSELRKKIDAIKWNLKKIESIVYDIEMKDKK